MDAEADVNWKLKVSIANFRRFHLREDETRAKLVKRISNEWVWMKRKGRWKLMDRLDTLIFVRLSNLFDGLSNLSACRIIFITLH